MLRLTALLLALALVACSGDDTSPATTPIDMDGAQPPLAGFEAGAPCSKDNDCASGLVCLYPTASGCGLAFPICTPPPADPRPQPQVFCSCIADTIQACGGFATEAVDHPGACGDSGASPDGGVDAPVDQTAPPVDAPNDTSSADAADAADAADSE